MDVWHTKDLFKRHPSHPDLWVFHGRVDDIVVLSNGEKFNPVPSEMHISAHPLVTGALIAGQGRPQPCLLLSPKDESQTLASLVDAVWPTIEEANALAPGQARITRDMILLTTPSKPFIRSPKGTVVRADTTQQYQDDMEQLYDNSVSRNWQQITLSSPADLATVTAFVTQVLASAFPGHHIEPNDDLFVHGLDSLQTLELVKLLRAGVQAGNKGQATTAWISVKWIYQHPSIAALARAIKDALDQGNSAVPTNSSGQDRRLQTMETLFRKYTQDLPPPRPSSKTQTPSPGAGTTDSRHVLLTGSTGSLGTQLLVTLLADSTVTHITCLDRSTDAQARVTNALATWAEPRPVLDLARVSFHQADYSQPDLGLPPAVLAHLRETVDVILHNAWKVDFNHSLETFEAVHIRGVRNLIDISASSPRRPRLVFVSSISSVSLGVDNNNNDHTVPETLPPSGPHSFAAAQPMGYAESKAVAEHILGAAARTTGLDVAILRVGQIAGPVAPNNGARWNATEWFPLLLQTARTTGFVPAGGPQAHALDRVDWVPVDVLAASAWELATTTTTTGASPRVFHLVNPTSRPWATLLPVICSALGGGASGQTATLQEVSLKEWVAEVAKTDVRDPAQVAARPAVKILDFFQAADEGNGSVSYATDEARRASETLRALGPVQDAWVAKWIKDLGLS